MKDFTGKLRRGLLIALSIAMLVPAMNGFAVTQKQRAMNAYKTWLTKSTVYVLPKDYKYYSLAAEGSVRYRGDKPSDLKFSVIYLDNDNIPELVVKGKGYYYCVLSYKNGKVVRLYHSRDDFSIPKKYFKKRCFYMASEYGGYDRKEYIYRVNGKYIMKLLKNYGYYEYFLTKPSKEISAATFQARFRAYTGGVSVSTVKYYKNTAANRNSYLR